MTLRDLYDANSISQSMNITLRKIHEKHKIIVFVLIATVMPVKIIFILIGNYNKLHGDRNQINHNFYGQEYFIQIDHYRIAYI